MTTAYEKGFTRGYSGCKIPEKNTAAPNQYWEEIEKGFVDGQSQRI